MFDLNDAFLFVQAVDRGGFAPAARALGLSKSNLSTRVARLETQLGARLLNRTSRRFGMTAVGEDFYRHARAMLIEAETAELAVRTRLAEPTGIVRLTSSSATLHAGLGAVLRELASRHPRLRIEHRASNQSLDLVEEGLDLAVRAHVHPLGDSSLIQRKLGFSPRWLVAAPDYLQAHGAPDHPDALSAHDLVAMPSGAQPDSWMLESSDGVHLRVAVELRFAIDDLPTVLSIALAGLGIAAVPAGMCLSALEQGQLQRVLPDWSAGGALITLLTTHRRGQLPSVRAASHLIAEMLPPAMGLVRPPG